MDREPVVVRAKSDRDSAATYCTACVNRARWVISLGTTFTFTTTLCDDCAASLMAQLDEVLDDA